jgi:hypothetical protein
MKSIVIFMALSVLISCSQQNADTQKLQSQIDSLQTKLNNTYKPGLGEFMTGIQLHHAKLWFAGINKNWKMADFEMHEIGETLDDIKRYCTDRPEIKSIGVIDPAIKSIDQAIKQKDIQLFKKGFVDLTNNCNNCHKSNQHEFNEIIVPTASPVVNQDFTPAK